MERNSWRLIGLLATAAISVVGCATFGAGEPNHTVAGGRLLVAASAEPDRGDAPLSVQFEAEVYEGDEAVKPTFEWDFGDGSKKKRGQRVEHTFRKPGSYTVTVEVTNASGRRGRDELEITVEPLFGN